jgi:hypothetical protein
MGRAARVTVTGLDPVKRAFKELERKVARKVVRQAERTALGIPKSVAQSQWPIFTGKSKRSIRVRVARGPYGSVKKYTIAMGLIVGGTGADKKGKARPWWSSLIELGWTLGKRIRHGEKVVGRHKVTGGNKRIPGKHIMRKVMRATESRVKEVMTTEILAGIEREVGR